MVFGVHALLFLVVAPPPTITSDLNHQQGGWDGAKSKEEWGIT